MGAENIGIYPVDLVISDSLIGSPTLYLNLLIDAPTGSITGSGRLTQALAPPWGDLPIASVSGQVEETGFPSAEKLVRITGRYGIPFGPPPLIGHIEATVAMACAVNSEWSGKGSFDYGPNGENTARNCVVRNVTPKAEAMIVTPTTIAS